MPKTLQLSPQDQFPKKAIVESVQEQPKPEESQGAIAPISAIITFGMASAADQIAAWGVSPRVRDRQLRAFWPTESYLAGAVATVSMRDASFDWEVKCTQSKSVEQAVTDMLNTAIAGGEIGWVPFISQVSQDLHTTDNGAFIEIIRDPGMDANSKFKGPMAPVIGIAHLDSGQCIRTGNAEYPVWYEDKNQGQHKLAWWQVIAFSDYPSAIERMNGIGYCAVTRALRLSQIMRSIAIFKDEKIGGRRFKSMFFVSGVSRSEIEQASRRGREEADNQGQVRYIDPMIIASLDPEKPVTTAQIDLASLPDGFDLDQEMQWYIAGLALDFGVDYQEFAPLPGGNIGSSQQSMILHRKTSGKGPAIFMRRLTEAFKYYGVIPRICTFSFNDKNEQEQMEREEVRAKALEAAAIAVNAKILTPDAARKELVRRGIYEQEDIADIPEDYGEEPDPASTYIERGGNTIAEDARRQDKSKTNQTVGDRLRKVFGGK